MKNNKIIPWAIPEIGNELGEVQNIFKVIGFHDSGKKFEKQMSQYCNAVCYCCF